MISAMKRQCRFLIVILFANFFTGCTVGYHKDYGYFSVRENYDDGTVNAKMRGTMSNSGNESVAGSPYEIYIWLVTESVKDQRGCVISIKNVVLRGKNGSDIIVNLNSMATKFVLQKHGEYEANFYSSGLHLDYLDYDLNFEITFVGDCYGVDYSRDINMKLERNYQEREITFWDVLMGV